MFARPVIIPYVRYRLIYTHTLTHATCYGLSSPSSHHLYRWLQRRSQRIRFGNKCKHKLGITKCQHSRDPDGPLQVSRTLVCRSTVSKLTVS